MQSNVDFKDTNISVIGCGLMGGSILKALKVLEDEIKSVTAFDIDKDILKQIDKSHIATKATDDTKLAVKDADFVVVSLYPKAAADFINQHMDDFKSGCVITDICGVKREIFSLLDGHIREDIYFVGGHPMAGRERKGYEYSIPDLFLGCKYIITGGAKHAVEKVSKFADMLGAGKIVNAKSEEHDELIAYTSQLPHVLSVAYMLCAKQRNVVDFSAGSFRDITRVSMINDEMWSELFLENKDKLSKEIDDLIINLDRLKTFIDDSKRQDLRYDMKCASDMRKNIQI